MAEQRNIDGTALGPGVLEAPSTLRASAFRAKPLYVSQMMGLAYGLPTFLVGLAASAMTVYLALNGAVTETLVCAVPALLAIWVGARAFKHAVAPSWRHVDTVGRSRFPLTRLLPVRRGCSHWRRADGVDEATRKAAFAEREREQQSAWSRLTYRQRLDWLWQAKLFAARALQAAEARRAGRERPPGNR